MSFHENDENILLKSSDKKISEKWKRRYTCVWVCCGCVPRKINETNKKLLTFETSNGRYSSRLSAELAEKARNFCASLELFCQPGTFVSFLVTGIHLGKSGNSVPFLVKLCGSQSRYATEVKLPQKTWGPWRHALRSELISWRVVKQICYVTLWPFCHPLKYHPSSTLLNPCLDIMTKNKGSENKRIKNPFSFEN